MQCYNSCATVYLTVIANLKLVEDLSKCMHMNCDRNKRNFYLESEVVIEVFDRNFILFHFCVFGLLGLVLSVVKFQALFFWSFWFNIFI